MSRWEAIGLGIYCAEIVSSRVGGELSPSLQDLSGESRREIPAPDTATFALAPFLLSIVSHLVRELFESLGGEDAYCLGRLGVSTH